MLTLFIILFGIFIIACVYGYLHSHEVSLFIGYSDLRHVNFLIGPSYSTLLYEEDGKDVWVDDVRFGFFFFSIVFHFVYYE